MSVDRKLDHLVLPTRDLDTARSRLAALGFTVAPEGTHPFGTSNCCVYLGRDSFLEPLAVTRPVDAAEAAKAGNVFVGHDAAYRALVGDEGMSAIVLSTDDADADHSAFVAAGVSAGDPLTFSRPFSDPSGSTGTATFKLAFARATAAPAFLLFTCQRVGVPKVDRRALERHDNGAQRITSVRVPLADMSALQRLLAAAGVRHSRAGVFNLADIHLSASDAVGPALVSFAVSDMTASQKLLRDRGVVFTRHEGVLRIGPAPGQGAEILFQE